MVIKENSDFIVKYCNLCGWKVPDELIKSVLENNLSKIFCNECGNELMKEKLYVLERDYSFIVESLAKSKDISLRMYYTLKKSSSYKRIEKVAYNFALNVLYNIIEKYDLPRFVKNKNHLQKMIDSKLFICKGQNGFEKLSDQENVKYGGIIYIIKCLKPFDIYPKLKEKVYVGCTWKTKMKRFKEHLQDALKNYMKERIMPKRKIEYAILVAITDYLKNTYLYDNSMKPLDDFIKKKIHKKDNWQIKKVISELANILHNKYFKVDVIEVHRNYETTKNRE